MQSTEWQHGYDQAMHDADRHDPRRHMMTIEQQQELARFINYHSLENGCDMPDFAIAGYLAQCYQALCIAAESKVDWSKITEEQQ